MKQVIRNGVSFTVVTDTPDAGFWTLDNWEASNYAILKNAAEDHKIFVHAGAWIGPFTLFAARIYDDLTHIKNERTLAPYGGKFRGFDLLLTLK